MTATTVLVDDRPLVLLAGGRADLWQLGPGYDDWYLYDPETGSVAGKGKLEACVDALGINQHS